MKKTMKISDLPVLDVSKYLDSPEAIAEYLSMVMEDNDSSLLAATLGDIARARGMSEVAKASGITREALYKALRHGAVPRFDTVNRVLSSFGVRLVAQPIAQSRLPV